MNIKSAGSVIIAKDIQSVFKFISNLENDKIWRKEINQTVMSGPPGTGIRASESSYLSKRCPDHILELICTDFAENKLVIYETIPESKFYLKSSRSFASLSPGETRFDYTIEFDSDIVKQGLGFSLPVWLIEWVTRKDMKKYFAQLKLKLEGNN